MFGNEPFMHWPVIVGCAIIFALLFEAVIILGEFVLTGTLGVSWITIAFAVTAFFGFVGVASWIRSTL
jgi:hypothetical protein